MASKGDVVTHTDWQPECVDANERVAKLYEVEEWTDCSFEFEDKIIKAHKVILAMSSPVFAAMFYGGVAQKEGHVAIVDIQSDVFTALLEYIYTDELNCLELEMACNLHYAAMKYMIPHLMKACLTFMTENLGPSNVCQTYEFAKIHDETALMNECLQMFSDRTEEIFNNYYFERAQVETMDLILSMDYLSISNELDLFKALAKYAKALRKRELLLEKSQAGDNSEQEDTEDSMTTVSTSSTSERNAEYRGGRSRSASPLKHNRRSDTDDADTDPEKSNDDELDGTSSQIRALLSKIRFLTLKPKEFANCRILNNLLSKDEILALSMNIASRHTSVPMPDGFCTTRICRNRRMPIDELTTIKTKIRFTVPNLSQLDRTVSASLPWGIIVEVYKPNEESSEKYLSVFLEYKTSIEKEWSCLAAVELTLLSTKPEVEDLKSDCYLYLFNRKASSHGFTNFVKWNELMDPEYGYAKDDFITLEAHVEGEFIEETYK